MLMAALKRGPGVPGTVQIYIYTYKYHQFFNKYHQSFNKGLELK